MRHSILELPAAKYGKTHIEIPQPSAMKIKVNTIIKMEDIVQIKISVLDTSSFAIKF
jgi:hypothetical protein